MLFSSSVKSAVFGSMPMFIAYINPFLAMIYSFIGAGRPQGLFLTYFVRTYSGWCILPRHSLLLLTLGNILFLFFSFVSVYFKLGRLNFKALWTRCMSPVFSYFFLYPLMTCYAPPVLLNVLLDRLTPLISIKEGDEFLV